MTSGQYLCRKCSSVGYFGESSFYVHRTASITMPTPEHRTNRYRERKRHSMCRNEPPARQGRLTQGPCLLDASLGKARGVAISPRLRAGAAFIKAMGGLAYSIHLAVSSLAWTMFLGSENTLQPRLPKPRSLQLQVPSLRSEKEKWRFKL